MDFLCLLSRRLPQQFDGPSIAVLGSITQPAATNSIQYDFEAFLQVPLVASNGYHFVGACGVGRVVDADFRVFGFDNLRVVDSSVIPDMLENSGPAASVYLLAELLAERLVQGAADRERGFRG